ncbi:porin family protein [Vibrio aestuarianus]|uniref:outer membrane beta-barrel protein n=1 Tax=Vibrio aestuarianus TaxID=28171 RepID=UPI00237D121D|nr:outer membrane beta-barrel protein [Vibrio aestuarianus]MDE1315189.1 porin family protein [Vibrio aestuarianus]
MNKIFTVLTIVAFTSGSAFAANNKSNFYVGFDYAQSDFPEIALATKTESPGYAIQLGYQLPSSGNWTNAFEIEYINAGSVKYNFDDTTLGIKGSGELELTAINLSYKPKLYLGRFFIGGQVGYASLSASGKANYTVMGKTTSVELADQIDSGLTLGGEIGVLITDQLSLKGGYRILESDTSTLYAGLALNF